MNMETVKFYILYVLWPISLCNIGPSADVYIYNEINKKFYKNNLKTRNRKSKCHGRTFFLLSIENFKNIVDLIF